MIVAEKLFDNMLNNVSREIVARVELLDGSTLLNTFKYNDALQSFSIDRSVPNNKFFGYGISQKLTVKLRDNDRQINIVKGQQLEVSFGVDTDYLYTCPVFYVDEVQRDENTNALTITAYDAIYRASVYTVNDVNIQAPYTIYEFTSMIAATLGMPLKLDNVSQDIFNVSYIKGANFNGSESLRDALDDIAEVTGTVYFTDKYWNIVFKKLDKFGDPVITIGKDKYFTLSKKTEKTLKKLTHATELGDNLTVGSNAAGIHHFIRDNAFLTLRDDANELLISTYNNVSGLSICQFNMKWRGNFLLEPFDKVSIVTKDDDIFATYVLNNTITYNGGLVETMSWTYEENDTETESNPVTIHDVLKNTYARVDKVNNEIVLLASETERKLEDQTTYTNEKVAEIRATTTSITQSVTETNTKIDNVKNELQEYANSVVETKAAEIKLTTDSISQRVTQTTNTMNNKFDETNGKIDEANGKINDANGKIDSTKVELQSSITQTASSIRSEISAQNQVITSIQQDLDGISLTYNSSQGTASITIGNVTVSNLVDGNYVEEAMAGINLTGYVKFNDLKNSGSTVINGDNITTGTISADRLNLSGSISWGDLTSSCKNTIASYAGADGSDAEVPSYIHNTYIDATTIYSPKIYGGELYAGTSTDGYIKMSSTGMNFISKSGGNLVGMGFYSGKWSYPYIVLGQGVDDVGTDKGLIKKYATGIWIGDSDSQNSDEPSTYSVGIFVEFTTGKIYRYNGSGTRAELT